MLDLFGIAKNLSLAEKQKVLDALAEQRANKGRGRPNAQHASRKAAAEASIARLQRGLLPGESEPVRLGAMSNDQLRTPSEPRGA